MSLSSTVGLTFWLGSCIITGMQKSKIRSEIKILLAAVLLFFVFAAPTSSPGGAQTDDTGAVWQAYQERYSETNSLYHAGDPLAGLFQPELDEIFYSNDGNRAVLWLALRDPNGHLLATEPGVALALKSADGWQIVFKGEADWEKVYPTLPAVYFPAGFQDSAQEPAGGEPEAIHGYYLPYVKGTAHKLEGSILHFHHYPPLGYPSCAQQYCRYAYDFTDVGHFPLVAARAGTVISLRDSCADGSTACTNYILLQDVVGGAYQIYLHLAHNSIPNHLSAGSYVGRGVYIGDTDDTGYSTSEHVHFMVVNSFWSASDGSPWGASVDVRFSDVPINNGIPRTCYEVAMLNIFDGAVDCLGSKADPLNPNNDWYVSGNVGANPPTGQLTRPASGAVVASGSNPLMDVTAATQDDVRVKTAVLQALIGGSWQEIGPRVSNPSPAGDFDWDVNLCQAGAFNGPLEIALKIWDHEGNEVSLLSRRTIQVDHACPPPLSTMTAPETFDGTAFKLNWTASDAGAGIGAFQIQWREGAQAWSGLQQLEEPSDARSAWFVGLPGKTYAFRLRALDSLGQAEAWPAGDVAEVVIDTPANCLEDEAEQDDNAASAVLISTEMEYQRNMCALGDEDWFRFETGGQERYWISARPSGGGAAASISLFDGDGATLLGSATAPALNRSANLSVLLPKNQTVLIKVEGAFSNLSGTGVLYVLKVERAQALYLPIVGKAQ